MPDPRYFANRDLFKRYLEKINETKHDEFATDDRLSLSNLAWICQEAIQKHDLLPIDKASRWLGFVQGCLAMRRIIDVDEERDISRDLYHRAYKSLGIPIPKKYENPSSS